MSQELELVGTVVRADIRLNELPRFLARELPDLPVFEWKPRPGVIAGAMFDWVAVLGTAADLLAVGGALWAAYEYLLRKRQKPSETPPPAFLVQVKTRRGTFVQFTLEKGQQRDVFIHEFVRDVSTLRESPEASATESLVEKLESSDVFVRVEDRNDF